MKQTASFGTWKSPISSTILSEALVVTDSVLVDKERAEVYYVETRPSEGGRGVLLEAKRHKEILEKHWDVRTLVHEYGGVPATANAGVVYFSSRQDKRVYKFDGSGSPQPVTPENLAWRYADLKSFQQNPSLLLAIQEDHTHDEPSKVVNKLVAINADSQAVTTFAEGADFYAFPVISPNGKKVAWIQWYLPYMPWEGSELVIADLIFSGGTLRAENPKIIYGETGKVSVNQPSWLSDDVLLFLTDSSGYTNPWKYTLSTSTGSAVLTQGVPEDFSEPAWRLGRSDSAILDKDRVLYSSTRDGRSILSIIHIQSGLRKEISSSFVVIRFLIAVSPNTVVFIGKKDDDTGSLVQATFNENNGVSYVILKSMSIPNPSLSPAIISKAQSISLSIPPSFEPVHVIYYPPFNPDYDAIPGERPPAVIQVHGGPTARAEPGLAWEIQFWTTRGWAWVDINYGGSSGYGRKYIERLKGQWGVVDVNDTINAVTQLGEKGLFDPKRCAFRGGSAGGFTVLATLPKAKQLFAVGTSAYGIADLGLLAKSTHKFQSGYVYGLLGCDKADQAAVDKVAKERSPLTHADKIDVPLLILQGTADVIVPPSQAEIIVDTLQRRNGRVKYVLFEGEAHGWKKAENIRRAVDEELAWYEEVFELKKGD